MSGRGIAERSLDLAGQVVARGRERVIHSLDDGNGLGPGECVDDLPGGERAERENRHAPGRDALLLAQIIDDDLRRLHVAAHADENELGVLAPVRTDVPVVPARLLAENLEGLLQGWHHAVVVPALRDLALHVRILVLHHPGHERVRGVHEVGQLHLRIADEFFHQVVFDQPHRLDRMRSEEAVLNVEEWRLRRLGHAAGNEAEVTGFLGVAGEEHSPAAVGHAHHVVVTGMHVQALARERPRPNVHHDRQALAADRVEHFLHEHEALPRGEVGDAAAGHGEPLAHARRRVLALRFEEHERVAEQVLVAVHNRGIEPAAHRGGTRDRIGTGRLADGDFHVNHGFRAVARRGDARILVAVLNGLADGFGSACRFLRQGDAHGFSLGLVMEKYEDAAE